MPIMSKSRRPSRFKIGQGVRHAEGVRVWNPGCGDIGELAFAVVLVKIETGKVTDDNKVEIAVVVQIRERSAVKSDACVCCPSLRRCGVTEIAMTVIKQKVGRIAIVGVIKGFGMVPLA